LIVAMLDKGPNELFLVDTVYKAAKLNVMLYGTREASITVTGLCNACTLFHHGTGIELSLDEPPADCDAGKENIERRGNQIWFGGFGSEGLGYCVAQVPSPYGAPFGVSRSIIWDKNNRPQGDAFDVPYNWYLYPAATNIKNLQYSTPVPPKTTGYPCADNGAKHTYWLHNGSILCLVADGDRRLLFYDKPRQGMIEAGARKGDLLFSGLAVGMKYVGTAYIFSSQCGKFEYEVRGEILDNYRRVQLSGQAPRIGDNCNIIGRLPDKLEFSLIDR